MFRAEDCSYNIPQAKRNTARSILFSKLKIPYCYTVESSFGIADGRQICSDDLIDVGRSFANASIEFLRYLEEKPEEAESKCLVDKIKLKMSMGCCKEKMESESEDSSFEEEVASPRKMNPAKTPEDKSNPRLDPTPRNKDFSVARRSVQKYHLSRMRAYEDEHSDDGKG